MKQLIIVAIIVFIITISLGSIIAKELLKKKDDSKFLEYRLKDVDFPLLSGGDLAKIIDGREVKVALSVRESIKNPTDSTFNISHLKLELSTLSGDTILEQNKPLSKPLTIQPQSDETVLELHFDLQGKALAKLVQEVGGIIQAGINKLQTGEFGFKVRLTGNLTSEGFNVEINEIISF